jgi:uncharacterized protein
MKRAIIIMTKIPRAGNVKTRLQPYLSPEQSAELATAFLQDAEEKARKVCDKTIIAFAPPDEKNVLLNLISSENIFVAQNGKDLGERMFNAFEFAFENDSDSVIMIGTDSPSFPAEFIEQAFEFLENSDAVLGESEDGGYYLIGLKTLRKEIFENVEWSSPETFVQTVRNIEKCGLDLSFVPKWHDVDFPEDLKRLKKELNEKPELAPKTTKWLKENEQNQLQ